MQFTSIQILRAVAALFVVLVHIKAYLSIIGNNNATIFAKLPHMLSYGAEMFFTISGFIMAYLIDSGYNNFLARRLARIYPTYILAAILTIFFKVMAIGSVSYPNLLKSISLLPAGITTYPLNIEWTLIYEVFFYLVCAVFTLKKLNRFFPHFLSIWLIIVLIATLKIHIKMNPLPTLDIIFFQIYNMFFIVGALTFYIHKKLPTGPKLGYLLITPWVIYVLFWQYLVQYLEFSRVEFYLFSVCCSLLILGAMRFDNRPNSKIYNLFVKLGDYSYAIYLVHAPTIVILYTLYQQHVGPLNTKVAVVTLLISLCIGWWFGKVDVFLHGIARRLLGNKKTSIPKNL